MRRLSAVLLLVPLLVACGEDDLGNARGLVKAAPVALEFGQVFLGGSASKEVKLSNTGRTAVQVKLEKAGAGDYRMKPSSLELGPGGDAVVQILFEPAVEGRADLDLVLSLTNAKNDEVVIPVRGEGVLDAIGVDQSLDFGLVRLGETKTLPLPLASLVELGLDLELEVQGSSDAQTFHPSATEVSLGPAAEQDLEISFTPVHRGPHQARLQIAVCDVCAPVTVLLKGEGGVDELEPVPAILDFRTILPGTSRTISLTIRNSGSYPETVSSVAMKADSHPDFSVAAWASTEIPPGSSASVDVTFSASEPVGDRAGTVQVLDGDGKPYFTVPTQGHSGGVHVVAVPDHLDFGAVPKGVPATVRFLVQNIGEPGPVVLSSVSASGSGAGRLSVVAVDGSEPPWTLTNAPLALEATFLSLGNDAPGNYDAKLRIHVATEEQTGVDVPVLADVVELPPCDLEVRPPELRFGAVTAGRSHAREVEVVNRGSSDCVVWGFVVANDGQRIFSLPNPPQDPTSIIPPGDSLKVTVRYAPLRVSTSLDTARLFFHHTNAATPIVGVPLSGLSTKYALVANPDPVRMGTVPIGYNMIQSFTVANSGADPAPIVGVGVGGGSQHFDVQADDTLPFSLQPASWRGFKASYVPAEAVDEEGQLEIYLQGVSEPFLVDVQGSGSTEPCGDLCAWPTAICPLPQTLQVNTATTLGGAGFSPGGHALTCQWNVLSAPVGSHAVPGPGCNATFTPDIVGAYIFELVVTDELGHSGSCQATLQADPWGGLWVEMFWDANDDVDLHLLNMGMANPSTAASWWSNADCYYGNCTNNSLPTWDGSSNATANLDRDDTVTTGPENIRINVPSTSHDYAIGVTWYSNYNSWDSIDATTNVYCGGTLIGSVVTTLDDVCDFVLVGTVDAGTCTFTADGTVSQANACAGP